MYGGVKMSTYPCKFPLTLVSSNKIRTQMHKIKDILKMVLTKLSLEFLQFIILPFQINTELFNYQLFLTASRKYTTLFNEQLTSATNKQIINHHYPCLKNKK